MSAVTAYGRAVHGFPKLPARVQGLRAAPGHVIFSGWADVVWGPGVLPWLVARVCRFPRPGRRRPTVVSIHRTAVGEESMHRNFGGELFISRYCTVLHGGRERICERYGPVRMFYDIERQDSALDIHLRGFSLFGLPMPRLFWPNLVARERVDGSVLRFLVDLGLPLIGPLVRYEGYLHHVDLDVWVEEERADAA